MNPIFRKCLKAINHINDTSLPQMEQSYKQFVEKIKTRAMTSICLNESKAIAISAQQALDSNSIDNKHVKKELENLVMIDKQIISASKELNEKLQGKQSEYTSTLKQFIRKNHDYLYDMKEGQRPAEELLVDIVKLGKEIQNFSADTISMYQKEIENFITKLENNICNDAYKAYNAIIKLDKESLPKAKSREWTYVEPQWMNKRGAFVDNTYLG